MELVRNCGRPRLERFQLPLEVWHLLLERQREQVRCAEGVPLAINEQVGRPEIGLARPAVAEHDQSLDALPSQPRKQRFQPRTQLLRSFEFWRSGGHGFLRSCMADVYCAFVQHSPMNAPLLPEVLLRPEPSQQVDLQLATEGVLRYLWSSQWGEMLLEVVDGQMFVNGSHVQQVREP